MSPFSRRVHAAQEPGVDAGLNGGMTPSRCDDDIGPQFVRNIILANNATAVAAAAKRPSGSATRSLPTSATHSEGPAEEVGRDLAEKGLQMRAGIGPTCRRPLANVGAAVQLPPQACR